MDYSYRPIFVIRLKELMKENEMRPIDLARITHCDYHAVVNWLNGTYLPRYSSLLSLRNYFQVSIDFLLGLTEDATFVNSSIRVTFTTRLEELMLQMKLTKYALAKKLSIGQPTVSRWFTNGTIPETTTLIKLSELFGVSIEYLVGLID